MGVIAVATVAFVFWWGLYKMPNLSDARIISRLGLGAGFLSAAFWGVSVVGSPLWAAWFNFFAASFAAMSLGYLATLPN
jgi:hypothetical protein